MRSLIRSPALQFLVLGTIGYFLYVRLQPDEMETLHVTSQTINALVQQTQSISQSPVSEELRKELIESHIEEEVLIREAYKRGFDKNDFRIRRRVLALMRSSLSEVIPEPSVEQLRTFYEENRERYQTGPSVSFEHVFFSFASGKLPSDPEQFIGELAQREDFTGLGDFSLVGNRLSKQTFERTAITFGKPFTEEVFKLPMNIWKGPIESFIGVHYVRVTGVHEAELPPFEEMEAYLRTDYLLRKGRESQLKKIEGLRKNYRIVVDDPETEE